MSYAYDPRKPRRYDGYTSRRDADLRYGLDTKQDYYSDPRYAQRPPPSPRASSYSYAYPPPPATRRQRRWPPSPSVEEEADAVRREWGAPSILDGNGGEACMRGAVDQDPIMLEVSPQPSNESQDRRFVLVSDSEGERDKVQQKRRRPSEYRKVPPAPIKTDLNTTPEVRTREPSPYSFTPSQKQPSNRNSAEFVLSPDFISPPSAASSDRSSKLDSRSRKDSKQPVSRRPNIGDQFLSPTSARNEDAIDDSDTDDSARRDRRRPGRYSFTRADLPKPERTVSFNAVVDTSDYKLTGRPSKQPLKDFKDDISSYNSPTSSTSSSGKGSRLNTPTSSTQDLPLPRHPQVNSVKLDTPFSPASGRKDTSRKTSPIVTDRPFLPSPPHSPPRSPPSSRPVSRSGSPSPTVSGSASPPPSPTRGDYATYPTAKKDRGRPASKLSNTMRTDSLPPSSPSIGIYPSSPARPPKGSTPYPTGGLPYPEDSFMMMPSEEHFNGIPLHSSSSSYTMSSSPMTAGFRENTSIPRPGLVSRNTLSESVPKTKGGESIPPSTEKRTKKDSKSRAQSPPKTMPACPRIEPTSQHDDWFCLENYSSFNVCPTCREGIVDPSPFADHFVHNRRRGTLSKTKCDFGDPWTRLVWLMTLRHGSSTPTLVYALANICATQDECPGHREASGDWYAVADPKTGSHVQGFYICPADVRKVETLFPSLKGHFSPARSIDWRSKQVCALRTGTPKWNKFLDILVEVDDEATARRSMADIRPFISLVKKESKPSDTPPKPAADCPRDVPAIDGKWHTHPHIPGLTVCASCYNEVIAPLSSTSKLARDFSTSPKYLVDDSSRATCQLYSQRMRRVFQNAVRNNDLRYLIDKVTERREIEKNLRVQRKALERLIDNRGSGGSYAEWSGRGAGMDKQHLREDLERLKADWRAME